MKFRIIAAFLLGFIVFNLGGSTFADTKAKRAASGQLVALLPDSDGVAVFDVRRFFTEAMPQVLASNQPMLAKITADIDEFKQKTGIDVRQFDEVAVGVATRQISAKKYDIDPVVIARGQMTSAALIGAAKLASNSKYREERIGGRAMYVFDAAKVATTSGQVQNVVGNMTEVAVASLDDRTIAFGDVARVRMTLEGKSRVGSDLTVMLEKNPASVAAFAAKTPAGLKSFLPLENDELGKSIDSIQYVYGFANVMADKTNLQVTARTLQSAQATSLFETLEGLQMLGKAFLGNAKGDDKKVYARLIENAKFAVKGNEVSFDLSVPQSDVDFLVGMIK